MLTLQQAKAHLNLTHDLDDALVSDLILESQEAVERYLDKTYQELEAEYGSLPRPVLSAQKLMLGHLYENREATTEKPSRLLAIGVDALLNPFRNFFVR